MPGTVPGISFHVWCVRHIISIIVFLSSLVVLNDAPKIPQQGSWLCNTKTDTKRAQSAQGPQHGIIADSNNIITIRGSTVREAAERSEEAYACTPKQSPRDRATMSLTSHHHARGKRPPRSEKLSQSSVLFVKNDIYLYSMA